MVFRIGHQVGLRKNPEPESENPPADPPAGLGRECRKSAVNLNGSLKSQIAVLAEMRWFVDEAKKKNERNNSKYQILSVHS